MTNVAWVWTPSAVPPNTRIWLEGIRKIENYYPGDDYVDWAGGDTYNAKLVGLPVRLRRCSSKALFPSRMGSEKSLFYDDS